MDSIKPYLATYLNLTDVCQHINGGTRERRSVTQRDVETYQRFVVGLDGKCSGKQADLFCNGELQPGRRYRVKTFACTINGCTETRYSNPISTDPDLTVAVASGISSAVVVLVVVGVVIFLLRRKQLACFLKDEGRLVTQSPDEGIHLDKIEHTKKNPSR
ncbi:uncharacterized protein LOC132757085 [Ruditapes philippinarum]|uniref:uncharacterized protein LOC132757085 n=1 Tax=Ruditapes philippinarum TaxID=129788 RepID=UPI00295ACDEF|nr:uncharacterized protein LOC132757085 [Ruditapes philippinarum]